MSDLLGQIKQGASWLWSQGDYPRLALLLEPAAAALAVRCVLPGSEVLDVAAGNGNFALAAARLGGRVTATDLSPRMVELGAARSALEGFDVAWRQADAEALPFDSSAFDVVASVFGAMFAPRPEQVASEMFRVVRPGGTVAMANYSPDGYLWRLSELLAKLSTRPGVAFPSPFLWGDEHEVRKRLEPHAAAIELETKTLSLEFDSREDWLERFATVNPPLMAMKAILPSPAFDNLIDDAWALYREGSASTYVEVVTVK